MKYLINAVGIDHFLAPVDIRSRFSFTDTQKLEFSQSLSALGCLESVVVSTCNRSEVYFLSSGDASQAVTSALLDYFDAGQYASCLYTYTGEAAMEHLFRVAAGLESAVLGEDQILGQVRAAAEFAALAGTCGKYMGKLFRQAVTAAKQIKSQLGISEIPLSVSYIAIRKLQELMGQFMDKSFMVVGTGKMSTLAVKYLSQADAGRIILCSRSPGSAAEKCDVKEYCVEEAAFADRYEILSQADAVITATASPHEIFFADKMPPRSRPLYIADLAVPPDVSKDMAKLDGVTVINIDQLNTISTDNMERRQALTQQAEQIIAAALEEFIRWLSQTRVDTAMASLNHRCDAIAADTEQYLFHKLELSSRDKKLISKMINASLKRLVREPLLKLKEIDDLGKQDDYVRIVKELFDI